MAKAIEQGIPKMRIEEAAARTQARIDSGAQKVIGVNTYRLAAEDKLDVLRVDNDDVYRQQIAKLERLRAERDDDEVRRSLEALTSSAERGAASGGSLDGNLLALAVDAARAKATVGEISDALEKVYGRHQAVIRTISGVFRDESSAGRRHAGRSRCSTATDEFEEAEGRRPRILVAKMGQDGHDRGQKVIVSARSPTWASTSTWARCSPRPRRSPSRRSTPTCTSSGSPRWPPATSRCCPRSSRRWPSRGAPTS